MESSCMGCSPHLWTCATLMVDFLTTGRGRPSTPVSESRREHSTGQTVVITSLNRLRLAEGLMGTAPFLVHGRFHGDERRRRCHTPLVRLVFVRSGETPDTVYRGLL